MRARVAEEAKHKLFAKKCEKSGWKVIMGSELKVGDLRVGQRVDTLATAEDEGNKQKRMKFKTLNKELEKFSEGVIKTTLMY